MEQEHVYIFDFGDRIKAGFSKNVPKRLRTVELASGIKVKQTYFIDAGRKEEKIFHSYLENRLEGEFFAFPFDKAKEILDKISNGTITTEKPKPNPKPKRKTDTPKTPPSKRQANNRWDKQNMITLGCKVMREDAEAFKAYASNQGKTANTILKEYVLKCIAENPQD